MRSTIAIDDDLLAKAKSLTQIDETSKVVREALKAPSLPAKALGGWPALAEATRRRRQHHDAVLKPAPHKHGVLGRHLGLDQSLSPDGPSARCGA